VGLGGAGQRHLRILHDLLPASTQFTCFRKTRHSPLLRSDFTVEEGGTLEDKFGLHVFESMEAAFANKPDLTVIATPTSCHRIPLMLAAEAGSAIIVEKPWAEDLADFQQFANIVSGKELPFLISFQRRYHPLIAKAHKLVKAGSIGVPLAASFTVFSDVRTWHGYENWKNLYAVRPELGGGVLLTEIHEIDLASWFFGMPDGVVCSGGNRSTESLDVEDTVQMTLLYRSFSVQITLCFMHENRERSFHIAGTEGDIWWNEADNILTVKQFKNAMAEYSVSDFSNDMMFKALANDFVFHWNADRSRGSLEAAFNSLSIVSAAKRSMQSGQVETPVSGEQ
jgi:predicted dehydrogenase